MKNFTQFLFTLFLLTIAGHSIAQKQYNAIYSGIPWFDDRGEIVSAHAAGIIKDGGRYYMFGEKHSDTSNAFAGFNCYSSADLYNWKFERIALPPQDSGRLGPNRVGERVKVMKCPKTGEYIMLMHTDDLGYKDQCTGYATASKITGPYTFRGPLLFNGKPIRKWDMGTFQDTDGAGYLLLHSGEIYRLSNDYKSAVEQVIKDMSPECESPAILKKNGVYFWLGSYRTSWERNDNFYLTATSLKGPWTAHGPFAPVGSLTWNSQTTFVLPVTSGKDTTFMFMGDRWSYPRQASAATYVWQPFYIHDTSLYIPQYMDAWEFMPGYNMTIPMMMPGNNVAVNDKKAVGFTGQWQHQAGTNNAIASTSDEKGATVSIRFTGHRVWFYGPCGPTGGYAQVSISKNNGKVVCQAMVDMYSLNQSKNGLRFLSPLFPLGNYTLTITVMGEHSKWSDKKRSDYGSKGNNVTISQVMVN